MYDVLYFMSAGTFGSSKNKVCIFKFESGFLLQIGSNVYTLKGRKKKLFSFRQNREKQ